MLGCEEGRIRDGAKPSPSPELSMWRMPLGIRGQLRGPWFSPVRGGGKLTFSRGSIRPEVPPVSLCGWPEGRGQENKGWYIKVTALTNVAQNTPQHPTPHLSELSEVKVTQSCLTLCDPMDYTVHGILQARILEWAAFLFSRGSSQPRD